MKIGSVYFSLILRSLMRDSSNRHWGEFNYTLTMKKRIGIATWFYYANPGTAFQAYALQKYINSVSDYRAEVINLFNAPYSMRNAPILKLYAKEYLIERDKLSLPIIASLRSKVYRILLGLKAFFFCSFQRKRIVKYPFKPLKRPLSSKECYLINNRYDWVILGSDQLWNFNLSSLPVMDYYFLSFISTPKKGAYAPSLGQEDWPVEQKDRIKELLADFSFIGVRERQAKDVVQPLTNKPVHWSLDPVFLLDKTAWDKVAKKPRHEGDYIFEYCIIKSPKLHAVTERLASETGLPIIEHHGDIRKHVSSAKRMPHPSADTWLGYLINAKYVVTDSFHGSAFCVITNKEFFTIVTSNGSRIFSMLEVFGLQGRVLTDSDEIDPSTTIDWEAVNYLLEERRKESQDWLKASLNLEGQYDSRAI